MLRAGRGGLGEDGLWVCGWTRWGRSAEAIHTFTHRLLIQQMPAGLVAQLCHRCLVTWDKLPGLSVPSFPHL